MPVFTIGFAIALIMGIVGFAFSVWDEIKEWRHPGSTDIMNQNVRPLDDF